VADVGSNVNVRTSMIPKSGNRFSGKIMLKQKDKRDDDSKKRHHALDNTALRRRAALA